MSSLMDGGWGMGEGMDPANSLISLIHGFMDGKTLFPF